MGEPALLMQDNRAEDEAKMATQEIKKRDHSPLVLALALAVGLIAQLLGGPLFGIAGAIAGAAAGQAIVRYEENQF